MSKGQCVWCPWDCPSPEVAACRQPVPTPEMLKGVCGPDTDTIRGRLRSGRERSVTTVIRDLADYEDAANS